MRHPRSLDIRLWIALALGLLHGLAGEGLFFAWTQCRKVEEALAGDFKILALAADGVDGERLNVVKERLDSLPDAAGSVYVSRENILDELGTRDPVVARSISLLGENSLPAGFEVRLTVDGLTRLAAWVEAAKEIPEIVSVEFKPQQAQAVLQARACRRYLAVVLSLAFWALVLAAFYFLIPGFADPQRVLHSLWEAGPMMAWGGAGAAGGAVGALALMSPLQSGSMFWVWPPAWGVLVIVLVGVLGGWLANRLLP